MIRHRRTFAAAMVCAGIAMFGGTATAGADTPDEQFANAITAMGIPHSPEDDLSVVGKRVCQMLSTSITGNPNPLPAVRGVVSTLSKNLTKDQAVGLMRASSAVYCPQFGRFTGR